jgi:spore protease
LPECKSFFYISPYNNAKTIKTGEICLQYRTDLAIEAAGELGIAQRQYETGKLKIHKITVSQGEAANKLGKAPGDYVTVTAPRFSGAEELEEDELSAIAKELAAILPPKGTVLVAGLGNNDITPDAIGPRTVRQVLATRHISGALARQNGFDALRPAAAIAPGVLGQTGMEVAEIISALAKALKPAAVIAVDALAAGDVSRLGNTIQISSAGISPGSGVMNAREELSETSLGLPVIALGVPTVVDAAALTGENTPMMITPRDIDLLVGRAGKILSLAINKALQPQLSLEELAYLVG